MKLETYYRLTMLPPVVLILWLPISTPALVNSDGAPLSFAELTRWYTGWLLPYLLATVIVHLRLRRAQGDMRKAVARLGPLYFGGAVAVVSLVAVIVDQHPAEMALVSLAGGAIAAVLGYLYLGLVEGVLVVLEAGERIH
jgi:hypothetical protein